MNSQLPISRRASMLWRAILCCVIAAASHRAAADPPQSLASDANQAKPQSTAPLRLVVDGAAEPVPAFKFRLLPPRDSLIAGNAAVIYDRLVHENDDAWKSKLGTEPDRFLELPADKFPLDEARAFFESYRDVLEQLAAAARRSECDWSYVLESEDPLMLRLSDAQFMRNYARLLAAKARYDALSGNLPAAISTLRDGLALGRHVADGPFLVNQLIGQAIMRVMLERVNELVQQPGAPSLYWALAELPRPLGPLQRGADTESRVLELQFPALANLDNPDLTPNWQRLSEQLRAWAIEIRNMNSGSGAKVAEISKQPTEAELAAAREYLRDKLGRTDDEVAAMSPAEVDVRFTVAAFREICDCWRKWLTIPYAQLPPHYSDQAKTLLDQHPLPLAALLTPTGLSLATTQVRLDRQVARLQTIEALRMHAAATGKLPASFDEVTVVPVPRDPVTAQPFLYSLEGDVATLDAVETDANERDALRMPTQIQLRVK